MYLPSAKVIVRSKLDQIEILTRALFWYIAYARVVGLLVKVSKSQKIFFLCSNTKDLFLQISVPAYKKWLNQKNKNKALLFVQHPN